ncbi:MAG: NERD domain-containing protein [Oscillospiraceae bacterium]|jgi:signal peptidase I|nr:NERD domain-containing protein [Oscillospiraceae bacterium]
MIQLYKNKNANVKKLSFLFVAQVFSGMLPAVLFVIYVLQLEERNVWLGITFISAMLFSFAGYLIAGRRYNILVSGYRGEKRLIKIAKKLDGDYSVFTNLPVRYKKNRSEIDMLLIGESGVLIVEVKNHSGVLTGSSGAETWVQRKYYRKGKTTEIKMDNPFRQIKRQREILKSILRANGIDVWVDNILFFSGFVSLRLDLSANYHVASSENELVAFIGGYQSRKPLAPGERDKIIEILKNLNRRTVGGKSV